MTFATAFAQDSIEDLYSQVLEYYSLAQEEHEKGEYIKSYEYSQLANSIFGNASIDIYMQLALLMLNDLEQSVAASIERMGDGSGVENYNSIVNAYNAGKELHDKFNSFTASDDQTLIQSTFEDARDYYQASALMIGGGDAAGSNTKEITREDSRASQTSIDEANTKFLYLTRNDIISTKDSSYKSLSNNIDKMNKEKSQSLADENIKTMNTLIIDSDIQKMFDYADKGMAKANTMGSEVLDSSAYKNILATIETAKSQHANGDVEAAAASLANALVAMESECSIFKKLPQTYTVVKRSAALTDSFWRISGYDFVYADREKWPTLYDNNKDKVKYPGNPRVIEPDVILNIASITSEPREGHYQPSELYIPITVYYYLDSYSSNVSNSSENTNASGNETDTQNIDTDDTTNTSDENSDNIQNLEITDTEGTTNTVTNVLTDEDLGGEQGTSGITVESFSSSDDDDSE